MSLMLARAKSLLPPRILAALRALKHPVVDEPLFGMTGTAEQAFYTECTRKLQHAPGAIVDLGCWMGSTSIALAKGIEHAPNQMVFAFDRFIWEDWMNYQSNTLVDYFPGESFLPEVRRRIRPFRAHITLIQADLTTYTWDRGPIKILLVDAMKSETLAKAIATHFFPHLPAGAILIHQDFKHFYTPWIHILQYRLRSFCRLLQSVPIGGTVAFTISEPIPAGAIQHATDFAAATDQEADTAFEHSLEQVEEAGRPSVAAAHLMHYIHRREPAKARQLLARYPATPDNADFAAALERLKALEQP